MLAMTLLVGVLNLVVGLAYTAGQLTAPPALFLKLASVPFFFVDCSTLTKKGCALIFCSLAVVAAGADLLVIFLEIMTERVRFFVFTGLAQLLPAGQRLYLLWRS
mmetsp:Transcript_31597/g.73290  ORF Transcript_31597/g.73290 Transcript_31597/m.73290 type:complete len:105 (+) Transcript_31597:30-344(+)